MLKKAKLNSYKHTKKWRKSPLLLVMTLVLIFCAAILVISPQTARIPQSIANTEIIDHDKEQEKTGDRLIIPKLEVNSEVLAVATDKDGNMDTPQNAGDVAWFKNGIQPGNKGNAAITGHVDYFQSSGVFANLHKLTLGDRVEYVKENGETLSFVVVATEEYQPDSAPLQKVFGPSDRQNLNLITCSGRWNADAESYEKRLVVYTEFVSRS